MGLGDRLKQGADVARQKIDEGRQAAAARADEAREAQAKRVAEEAEREEARLARRQALHDDVRQSCPLAVVPGEPKIPGGLTLFDDEFLLTVGRDWGWSSQKLVLTTKRVIYSRGRALTSKDQQTVYLTDVRDVAFHKPVFGPGSLTLETAGGHSIEGLPAVKNGAEVRNQLLTLIHWARSQAEAPARSVAVPAPVAAEPTITEKLKQLGELHAAGVLTQEEFETKKTELLSRL